MRYNIILLIISFCFGLIILEFGLRYFTVFPINPLGFTSNINIMKSDKIPIRINPKLKGIDSNGFRNPKALKSADIVAVGDSHTYGNNVTSEYSWPSQLGVMANKTIYNLGIGSYSVFHYYYLMDEAIKLNPKRIIIGLFLVNDMKYTCQLLIDVYDLKSWARENDIDIELCRKYDNNKTVQLDFNRTALGSFVDYMIWQPIELKLDYFKYKFAKKENKGNDVIIIDDEKQPTMFGSVVNISKNLDLKRPEARTVFEITKKLFIEMKKKADKNNINFSVLIIPSKERAYHDYLLNKAYKLPDGFYQLVENERNAVREFSMFFNETGIRYADAQPYVANALYGPDKVFKSSDDGHALVSRSHRPACCLTIYRAFGSGTKKAGIRPAF
ncbi:MAG: hypothetical protein HY758_01595 [Nitrospirae bacterium]|nr:hypothetical protein [Nitrospirota bacterium]